MTRKSTRLFSGLFAATVFAAVAGVGITPVAVADDQSTDPTPTAAPSPELVEPSVEATPIPSGTTDAPVPSIETEVVTPESPAASPAATEAVEPVIETEPTPAVEDAPVVSEPTPSEPTPSEPALSEPAAAEPAIEPAIEPSNEPSNEPAPEDAADQPLREGIKPAISSTFAIEADPQADEPDPAPASIELTKQASAIDLDGDGLWADDQIYYSFYVTNTGGVTLENLTVTDPMFPGGFTCSKSTLAPGDWSSCEPAPSAFYTITALDEANEEVVNTAVAAMIDPVTGAQVTDEATVTTPLSVHQPQVTIDVDATRYGTERVGQTYAYNFWITNTGSVPLHALSVENSIGISASCYAEGAGTPSTEFNLTPGRGFYCTSDGYTVTEEDAFRGTVTLIGTVTGLFCDDGTSACEISASDTDVVPIEPVREPHLEMDKKVASLVDVNGNGYTDAGDTMTWSFTVTNTGNVAMYVLTVHDPLLDAAGVDYGDDCAPYLEPDASTSCVSDVYTVTQADVDAGIVANSAYVSGQCIGGGGGGDNRQANITRRVGPTPDGPRCGTYPNMTVTSSNKSTTVTPAGPPKPTPSPTTPAANPTPTVEPTPTPQPTDRPTEEPTEPTDEPSEQPTDDTSETPSVSPSVKGVHLQNGGQSHPLLAGAEPAYLPSTGGPTLLITLVGLALALLGASVIAHHRKQAHDA